MMRALVRCGAVLIAMAVAGCASSSKPEGVSLALVGDEGEGLRIELGGDWVRALLEEKLGTELECSGDIDGELEEMLLALDRRGRRSSAVLRGEEGVIRARRRAGLLELDVRGDGEGRVRITAPWAIAECLLGRSTRLAAALEQVEVRLDGPDGTVIRVSLDN